MINKHAFLIGADTYLHGFSSLPFVTEDIRRLSEVLKKICGFTIYETLTGENAAYENVSEGLESFFWEEIYDPNTFLLLYFSGHGFLDRRRNRGYLGCYNTSKTKRGSFLNALDMRSLKKDFLEGKLHARQVLIVLDCCHSGQMQKGMTNKEAFLDRVEYEKLGYIETIKTASKGSFALRRASGVLAACRELEGASPTPDRRMSRFTKYFIEALEGQAPEAHQNGVYSVTTISGYIKKRFKRFPQQRPRCFGNDHESIVLLERNLSEPTEKHRYIKPLRSAAPKPSPKTFIPLASFLGRSREFFPSKHLFEKDLIFFTESELKQIEEIQRIFRRQNTNNIFLLHGNPASGKTVMGIYIATQLEKHGFTVFYHKLTAKTDFDKIQADFAKFAGIKNLFVIDDCHLNLEVASEIFYRFEQIPNLNCLLCTRIVPQNMRRVPEFDYLDIFEELEKENKSFQLDTTDVFIKMSGIINKYKRYNEKVNRCAFRIGNRKQIIAKAKHNYLMLYFYLCFWQADEPLAELDEERVLSKMYQRYLGNAKYEPYQSLILKFAALFQFEIEFEPSEQNKAKTNELVVPIALLERNEEDYYSFYHADFARLLLGAYATRPKFKREFRNDLQKFTIEQFKDYFTDFKKFPSNLDEMFYNLSKNNGIEVFRALLQNDVIKSQAVAFFLNRARFAYELIRFLNLIDHIAPEHTGFFCEALIFENSELKALFENNRNPISALVAVYRLFSSMNDHAAILRFQNVFEAEEQRRIVLNSDFIAIGQSLSALNKHKTKPAAKKLLALITVEELTLKAQQKSFGVVVQALNQLKNIDLAKARQIFADIDSELLAEKARQVTFRAMGYALNQLKNIDLAKARQIFADMDSELLAEKVRQATFDAVGKALNKLKNHCTGQFLKYSRITN